MLKKPISTAWTAEDRLRVVAALLPGIQADIFADCYSDVGRPNITSVLGIIHKPPAELEEYRDEIETFVAEHEKRVAATR